MPAQAQAALDLDTNAFSTPALVVLGRDDSNKPHASWFAGHEADRARSAAATMGMMALVINDEIRPLADRLPHGKIFESGKAFVPFVKGELFDQLIAFVPVADQIRPLRLVRAQADEQKPADDAAKPPVAKAPALSLPADWEHIVPGSVVLATAGSDDGWWEAVVLDAQPGNMLNLRWRDFPTEPHFVRQASNLALLHTSRKPTD